MTNGQLLDVREGVAAADLGAPWQALAQRSLAPAGLMRPELMLPLLRNQPGISLHTVSSGDELLLALPVENRRLPPISQSWVSPLTPGGNPHLDRDAGPEAISALLESLRRPLLLQGIPATGPFMRALETAAPRVAVIDSWQRAALKIDGDHANWLRSAIDRKQRKAYRRQKMRLSEQGKLVLECLAPHDDSRRFAEALVELEAAGWKGRTGTAIKMQRGLACALAEACAGLHAAGALRFWQFTLDGRAVASLYAIIEGDYGWLGKIAYEESFAKYSPGVLLILEATERLFAEPGLRLVDSCAIPENPMINHLWRDRVGIANVLVSGPAVSPARFAALAGAERLRRRARGFARDALYRLMRKHRS